MVLPRLLNEEVASTREAINKFVEVSRGYLVNASYVMALKNKELIMRNGDRIPVARGSVKKILEGIAAYWNSEK